MQFVLDVQLLLIHVFPVMLSIIGFLMRIIVDVSVGLGSIKVVLMCLWSVWLVIRFVLGVWGLRWGVLGVLVGIIWIVLIIQGVDHVLSLAVYPALFIQTYLNNPA